MGELKKWLDEDWVRIGTDGSIKGACGTSKNKKNPDRCLPRKKAMSMTKAERARTAKKKKRVGAGDPPDLWKICFRVIRFMLPKRCTKRYHRRHDQKKR